MNNKNILITGITSGIGKETAHYFRNNNWYIIGLSANKPQDDIIDDYYKVNIANEKQLIKVLDQIKSSYSCINCLVNNAAMQISKKLINTEPKEWDQIFLTNVKPSYMIAKSLHTQLKQGSCSVINISSVHSIATSKNIAAYAATKGALLSLTRAMSLEFADDNIRVNAVLPGAIDTNMLRNGLSRGHLRKADINTRLTELAKKHPLKRIGRPSDVASLIYFLADHEKSSFITGQSFVIDGGATSRLSTE